MSIQWDNPEQSRILITYHNEWSWEDVYKAIDECDAMINAVSHTVDVIHNWQDTTTLPPGAMTHIRNLIESRHPRTDVVVIVGAHRTFTALWRVFSEFYAVLIRDRYLLTTSLEQAREIL